ncbi:hypothetical protein E3T26_12675 [Cryobacterium sp. TMT1-21]|uniref:LPD29 domain-containing protein n=1 Tax=Cryobacterium sp. TMT1-21 TaxID=1259234 RepID=UPI00106C286B|nr:LPD29 domain-containing protein [Cryobacterium sp. TMT1-21]TFD11528.1 hypothetical protein E3T26_12675 [Cryobacterium sp. TMT1-21]
MTDYISTKDTAKLVRVALKNAFPGVKFSVRMSTGTASAWMNVSWSDGPTDREVSAVTALYEGRKFNGMTDGYDDQGSALVAFDGEDMPRVVRYSCDGINTHRDYTAAGYRVAQHLISTDSDHKDLVVFTPEGEPLNDAAVPQRIYVAGHFHDYIYSPVHIAQVILHRVNLCTVTSLTR